MALRTLLVLLTLFATAPALADVGVFYEDNQADYYSWGIRAESPNQCSNPAFCGMFAGLSLESVTVNNKDFVTSYGHFRLALTPESTFSPYVNVGIDLLETGVLLLSDGDITPTVDVQYGYGLRINLGKGALGIYRKVSILTGYTIQDGTYDSYGIEFIAPSANLF